MISVRKYDNIAIMHHELHNKILFDLNFPVLIISALLKIRCSEEKRLDKVNSTFQKSLTNC